ncbi:hypothetical protein EJ07DRAFT_183647 [Lizonia empirigonia]|nr:hypothetical protein EJ07DRAFT_183647 [Lizonia empirigonia]
MSPQQEHENALQEIISGLIKALQSPDEERRRMVENLSGPLSTGDCSQENVYTARAGSAGSAETADNSESLERTGSVESGEIEAGADAADSSHIVRCLSVEVERMAEDEMAGVRGLRNDHRTYNALTARHPPSTHRDRFFSRSRSWYSRRGRGGQRIAPSQRRFCDQHAPRGAQRYPY